MCDIFMGDILEVQRQGVWKVTLAKKKSQNSISLNAKSVNVFSSNGCLDYNNNPMKLEQLD